ncbi:MAG: BCCT family transporter [Halobacteriales archaeon]|nr:BCCT family transporter [Halobacteriales archaeon]
MATDGTSVVERFLRKTLVPIGTISGVIVISGFFFPEFVGAAVSGETWLVLALLFFGSSLGYLAVLPTDEESEDPQSGVQYMLQIRRTEWTGLIKQFFERQDSILLGVPVVVFALFFVIQVIAPATAVGAVNAVRDFLLQDVGWVFLGVMFVAVLYCLFLLVGPWGEIKLGGPEVEPTYTYPTYFSLVFTAGIAAGIVFWGPAEALFHYQHPPPYFDTEPRSQGAIVGALTYALFHWGLSAWSAYTVIGVPVAYFVYQRDAPLRVSTILTPFLGVDNLDSAWAKLVDTLAIFATIGGIATSVALVSQQFLTGIQFQWGVNAGSLGPLLFVGGLTLIFVLSTITGVHRGIRRIAGLNIALFGLFGVLLLAVAPRSFIFEQSTKAVGSYITNFVGMSLFFGGEWVSNWTVWNWSWWFSWAPFAGLFLAALSRGRRIRTVVITGVVATSAATMVWFLLMGATSLQIQRSGTADILGAIAARGGSEAVAGFPIFTALPLSELLMFFFLALIVVFITTSADTSTLIVSVLATEMELAPTASIIGFWGAFQGCVAVAVLLVGGGQTLQAVAVLTGGPFAILSVVALVGLTLTFRRREESHRSPLRKLWERLPTIETHHDIDPPQND